MANAFVRGNKGKVGAVDGIGVSPHIIQVSSFGSDVDLTAISNNPQGQCCRKFLVNDIGSGTKSLVVTDAMGVDCTIDCTNMQCVPVEAALRTIKSTTTISKIIVFY